MQTENREIDIRDVIDGLPCGMNNELLIQYPNAYWTLINKINETNAQAIGRN